MKVCKPESVVEVCDRCHREGYLQACPVCGEQFCLTCRGIIAGCWVDADVCRQCSRRADVLDVVALHAAQITPIIRERAAALEALPAEFPQQEATK